MPARKKNRSGPRKSAHHNRKPAIVEIHPGFQAEASTTIDVDAVRQEMTKRVVGRALELLDDMLQHVKDGNFQAMKYLFEAVGLFPIKMEDAQSARNELGKKLSAFFEKSAHPAQDIPAPETATSSPAVK
jgi:hypothetical protein